MSSMITPGMSRLRAFVQRLLPFTANEPDPAFDDDGPIGETEPDHPGPDNAEPGHRTE